MTAAVAVFAVMPWCATHASASTPAQRLRSFMAGCTRILNANPNEEYILTDLNDNGFPELWISYNVGRHADYCWHVYHSENGQPKEVYSCPFGPIENYGNYVLVGSGNGALCLTYNGNRVSSSWQSGRSVSNESISTRNRQPMYNY